MPVTIKDIARELGISPSTVSRVLNGINTKNTEMVEKVKQKALELNYQVNTAAVGLRTNKTKLIGVVIPEINDTFFSEVLSGVEETAEAKGYNLLICQSHESADKESKLIKSLIACNVEGMLISTSIESSSDHNIAADILRSGKKLVFFDRVPQDTTTPYVAFQDEQAAYDVAKHVVEQGRKTFMYIGLSPHLTNDNNRLSGVQKAVEEHKLANFSKMYIDEIDQLIEQVKEKGCDAIICSNDNIAARALQLLREAGIQVPDDVAVAGFDNRAICDLLSPSLTSVDHYTKELGRKASEMLFSLLEDEENEVENFVLSGRVVVRESTVKRS